jgi:hypothetical protein
MTVSLEEWIAEREARKGEGPWYNTLQVCENDHVITNRAVKYPEHTIVILKSDDN